MHIDVVPNRGSRPAYLLREPDRKRDAWADLKLVIAELERLGIEAPGKPRG